jgi:hypothetical protein
MRCCLYHMSHKVWTLIAFIVCTGVCLAVKENYPFSNYPMYGDPDPISEYYHLADGDGKPLAVRNLTSVTCPQVGKILRGRGDARGKELGMKRKNMPPAEWEVICRLTLGELREKAKVYGNTLPEKLRIMHTTIEYKDGRVVETPRVFFAE